MAEKPAHMSAQREKAARLLAEDTKSDEEIAADVGIGARTLYRWKADEAFRARMAEIIRAYADRSLSRGIAQRGRRVDALHDRWRRMQRVIDERAAYPGMADVPGGASGLLVEQQKIAANGSTVSEYAVDTGLLKELRAHEQQAAQELGQWTEKRDLTSDGQQLVPNVVIVLPQKDEAPDLIPPDA